MKSAETKYLKAKDYVSYSAANLCQSIMFGLVQGYLFIFYTTVFKINPAIVGTVFLIIKIWDGINDPIMGTIIDRTRSKWGKMRPYLIFGSIPFSLITISLFIPWSLSENLKVVYMFITYFIWEAFSTVVDVPMAGISAIVSPNSNERTKIISIGRISGSIGGELSTILVAAAFLITKSAAVVYAGTAVVAGLIAPVFVINGGLRLKEKIPPSIEKPRIRDAFKYLFINKPLLLLISGNFLSFFRNIVSASVVYFVSYVYLQPSIQVFFILPGSISSLVGMIISPALKQRFEAKTLFIGATLIHSAGLAVMFVAGQFTMNTVILASLLCIAMMPVGILNVIPTLMCADTIDYMEWKTGQRQEGISFALMSLRSKIASGFKDFTMSLILVAIGFTAAGTGALIPGRTDMYMQSEFTQRGIFMMMTIIPAVTNLLSVVPFLFYDLSGEKLKKIREELAQRRSLWKNSENAPVGETGPQGE